MTWVKIDDHFADHPKIIGLSDAAYRAFVDGLCYSARYLTDGQIPTAAVTVVTRSRPRVAAALIDAGLWEQNGSGVIVHDYLEFQPSRSKVQANREARATAGRKGGLSSSEAKRQAKGNE